MMVADSDVLIDYLRGAAPVADRIALELSRGQLATTTVTAFELLAGAHSDRQRRAVETLLAAMAKLPLDEPAATQAATIHRDLQAKGLGIGMADSLIAGICLANDGMLLTRNRRHFARVPGLALGRVAPDSE